MKTLIKTLLFLIIIAETNAQAQPSWVSGELPYRKNTIFFTVMGKHEIQDTAKVLARMEAFRKIIDRNGLEISYEQLKKLESVTRGVVIIQEKEIVSSTTKIIGKKVGIKGLWQEAEWSTKIGKDYYQHYLYSIPDYNVGGLAYIPTAAQYIRKENGKAVIFSFGTLVLLSAPLVNVHSNNLRVEAMQYNTRRDLYDDYIKRADNALTLCRVMYAAGIITYIASTIDGVSKNKLYSGYKITYSSPLRVSPYFAANHAGLTLSVAIK